MFYFEAVDSGNLVYSGGSSTTAIFKYAKDPDGTWSNWYGNSTISLKAGERVYIKPYSTSSTSLSGSSTNYVSFGIERVSGDTKKHRTKVGGNLSTLINGATVPGSNYCFYSLFRNFFSHLIDASDLVIDVEPGTKTYCFAYMFYGCDKLVEGPRRLSGSKVTSRCCYSMFEGCSSLTTAPELPATTLSTYCYTNMFRGCTSLTAAPDLPATNLPSYCYYFMFFGCTSLTTAPSVLQAETAATSCCGSMFYDCANLLNAPALPATTLGNNCYSSMFRGCTSLQYPPALPSLTMKTYCYNRMFSGCTSLVVAPELPATTLADYCYSGMFYSCKLIRVAPALPATTLSTGCYMQMFENCDSLVEIPQLAALDLPSECYGEMFEFCEQVRLSDTKTDVYTVPYRIPSEGTGTVASGNPLHEMFYNTGGPFTGTPTINTTYYIPKAYVNCIIMYNGQTLSNKNEVPPIKVIYNDSLITSIDTGVQTLLTNYKTMNSNLVIGTTTLECKDKIMKDNVIVSVI